MRAACSRAAGATVRRLRCVGSGRNDSVLDSATDKTGDGVLDRSPIATRNPGWPSRAEPAGTDPHTHQAPWAVGVHSGSAISVSSLSDRKPRKALQQSRRRRTAQATERIAASAVPWRPATPAGRAVAVPPSGRAPPPRRERETERTAGHGGGARATGSFARRLTKLTPRSTVPSHGAVRRGRHDVVAPRPRVHLSTA